MKGLYQKLTQGRISKVIKAGLVGLALVGCDMGYSAQPTQNKQSREVREYATKTSEETLEQKTDREIKEKTNRQTGEKIKLDVLDYVFVPGENSQLDEVRVYLRGMDELTDENKARLVSQNKGKGVRCDSEKGYISYTPDFKDKKQYELFKYLAIVQEANKDGELTDKEMQYMQKHLSADKYAGLEKFRERSLERVRKEDKEDKEKIAKEKAIREFKKASSDLAESVLRSPAVQSVGHAIGDAVEGYTKSYSEQGADEELNRSLFELGFLFLGIDASEKGKENSKQDMETVHPTYIYSDKEAPRPPLYDKYGNLISPGIVPHIKNKPFIHEDVPLPPKPLQEPVAPAP